MELFKQLDDKLTDWKVARKIPQFYKVIPKLAASLRSRYKVDELYGNELVGHNFITMALVPLNMPFIIWYPVYPLLETPVWLFNEILKFIYHLFLRMY